MRSRVFIGLVEHSKRRPSNILNVAGTIIVNMTLGQRITEAREGAKLTQAELARRIGQSRSAINKWESGDTKNLKLDNLFKLAEKTGYSAKWIAVGEGTKREHKALTNGAGELNLPFLTMTIQTVERYLDEEELELEPEAKARLVTLLYEICADKGTVDRPVVAKYLRLVA